MPLSQCLHLISILPKSILKDFGVIDGNLVYLPQGDIYTRSYSNVVLDYG